MKIPEVQNLCKTYDTGKTAVHALNHVPFSVRKGEFLMITHNKNHTSASGRVFCMRDGVWKDWGVSMR